MYSHTFTGLTKNQIAELLTIFGQNCHHWDNVRGFAVVDFEDEEDCQNFLNNHEFTEED